MVDDSGRAPVDREAVTHLESARESGPSCRKERSPGRRVEYLGSPGSGLCGPVAPNSPTTKAGPCFRGFRPQLTERGR
jgi:hypothetical protein